MTRYVRWLWAGLGVVVIAILVLLAYLFLFPRPLASPVFSNAVVRNVRAIYRTGLANNQNPAVFSKVGDSITVSANFLKPIGDGAYNLGDYPQLQRVIDHYSDVPLRTGNSFSNQSLAAGNGWSAATVLDPNYAKEDACTYPETPLACEYRHSKPTVALIMLGTNDVSYRPVDEYITDMQRIVDISVEAGVVPVISTIPYQADYADRVAAYNAALRELTAQNRIPLWDYAGAVNEVPEYGLSFDGIHPNAPPWDQFGGSAQFTAEALQYGFTVRNLTALQMLLAVRQSVR